MPLVSFCLFTYNHEKYVVDAIKGVLNQDYDNLEIIISDDCSTDNTFEIIKQLTDNYSGLKRLIINRNDSNLGLVGHVNKILYEFTTGELIAVAAGDDISKPERITKSINFLTLNPDVVALSTNLEIIQESENRHNINEIANNEKYNLSDYLSDYFRHINGSSRIFSRKLLDKFPPLNFNCETEDSTYLLRSFLIGKVALLEEKLVKYRVHSDNMSSVSNLKKMDKTNILNQYYDDINFALLNNYIDQSTSQHLKKIIKKRSSLKQPQKPLFKGKIMRIIKTILFTLGLRSEFFHVYWSSSKHLENKNWDNFGDAIVPVLIEKMSQKKVQWSNKQTKHSLKKVYLTIGSILEHASKNNIVWGAGIMSSESTLSKSNYIAVRGPISYSRVIASGHKMEKVWGDPALLCPLYFPIPKATQRDVISIIPHYVDYEKVLKQYGETQGIEVIDLKTNNIESVIAQIATSKKIFSSSLHGLIVGHAYGVESVWVQFSEKLSGDDIKFNDYFMSVGIRLYKPFDFETINNETISESLSLPNLAILNKIQLDLIKTCPFI